LRYSVRCRDCVDGLIPEKRVESAYEVRRGEVTAIRSHRRPVQRQPSAGPASWVSPKNSRPLQRLPVAALVDVFATRCRLHG
jgi:hypothetical protein